MSRDSNVEINLQKFDMKKLKRESIIVVLGKRNTGKSFLIKDILYHHRLIPVGLIMSQTDHLVHFYDKFFPKKLIYNEYKASNIDKIFERQTKALDENWKDPSVFILLDDCLSDANAWKKDECIKKIFFNGRHFKILFILAMQSPMGLIPAFRTNIDFTFILKNNNASDRERIYKNYAGMFPSREIFEIVLDNCTEDYNCLVIDNTTNSNKLEDQVFYYKASFHDDFRMGAKSLWLNNETSAPRKDVNIEEFRTKRGKFTIKK